MKHFFDTLKQRWRNAMPKFFRIVFFVCSFIGGTAAAVNTAIVSGGGTPHQWWQDIYPYLLGIPAGMAFAAKFTQTYDSQGNPIGKTNHSHKEKESNEQCSKPSHTSI